MVPNLCHSIKSKKEPNVRCPRAVKNGNNLCGVHARAANLILFPGLDDAPPEIVNYTYPMLLETDTEDIDPKALQKTMTDLGLSLNSNELNIAKSVERLKNHLEPVYTNALKSSLGCLTDFHYHLCQNHSDFFQLDDLDQIPRHLFFSFQERPTDPNKIGAIYGCDIRSFQQYLQGLQQSQRAQTDRLATPDSTPVEVNNLILNVYNRQPLDENTIVNYRRKLQFLKQHHPTQIMDFSEELPLTPKQKLKFKILDVFQVIYQYDYPVDHTWFTNLNKQQLLHYYSCLEELWNFRLNLTAPEKNLIVPGDINLFNKRDYNRLRRLDHIVIQEEMINIMEKMVTKGRQLADRKNGAMYLLTGLVQVCPAAAQSLPFLAFALGF